VIRIIDNPSKVRANPMLKAGDVTRFLSISKTPIRITITFKTKITNIFDFIIGRIIQIYCREFKLLDFNLSSSARALVIYNVMRIIQWFSND